jgi:DNA-binding response OmpR family regulator
MNMRKARIIIFDDDPVILDMLGYYFSVKGFEVQSFAEPILCHPSESASSCLTPCSDIIITDFRMPQRPDLNCFTSSPARMHKYRE